MKKLLIGLCICISLSGLSFASNNNHHYKCIECACTPWGCGCCTVPDDPNGN